MNGAECIAAQLKAQGIGTVFSVAGASHTHLLDALDKAGLAIVSSRHESGAVGAADGYARALADQRPQRPSIAMIVSEQGLANAVGGLAVAHALGSPVVVLVAIPPIGFVEEANVIAAAQVDIVRPVSKWATVVPCSDLIQNFLCEAITTALIGRPGPVVLFLPQDLFLKPSKTDKIDPVDVALDFPDDEPLERAAAILATAERPIAIAGIGAHRGRAREALNALAARGVPVLGNGSGRGLVPEDGERGWSWPFVQRAACEADCVLVVGEVLTQRLGFGLPPRFAANAKFIQIDADPAAFHRNRPTDAPICGAPGEALTALLDRVERYWDAGWFAEALAEKAGYLAALGSGENGMIHPLALGRELQAGKPAGTFVVGDGADIQNWMYGSLSIDRPGGFIDHFPLGAMGSGTAMAVGAAAALAELHGMDAPPVLLVTGDGSIGFHPAELHAAALAALNLKVVVGNDAAWGTEVHGQHKALGRTINTQLGDLPYAKLGEAFGCVGMTCSENAELEQAIADMFATPGPVVLDVKLDPHAGAELKSGSLASSIIFSDLVEGQSALGQAKDNP